MSKYDLIYSLVDATLKEQTPQKCPEGYRWCKIQLKCVPAGQGETEKGRGRGLGRGQAKGPMGKPFQRQKEMFAADFPEIKETEKIVDVLIDSSVAECGDAANTNAVQNTPSEQGEEELQRVHADIAGYGDPEDEEKEYPPGPQDSDDLGEIPEEPIVPEESDMREQLEGILKEETYKEFFKKMMDKEGIKSIGDLSDEKKKAFFNKIDPLWKGKNESLIEKGEYHAFFKRMMDKEHVTGLKGLSIDQKKSFFRKVSAGWKKEKGITNEQLISHLMTYIKK